MTVNCVPCDRSFPDNEALRQHKRDSPAHAFNCIACDRRFGSSAALEQHLQYSPAHAPSFNCGICDRSFSSEEALAQHLRDSPAHVPSLDCNICNRSFGSQEALEQHQRDSPSHAPSFSCEICNRPFSSMEALGQHQRDSHAHIPSFDCNICNRSFGSDEALAQHLKNSPVHAPSFDCSTCDRSFSSEDALEQHIRDSAIHQQLTPLDLFFLSFRTFEYDPSQPPATSFAHLQRHEGWQRDDPKSSDAWDRYQDALESELRLWYGEEDSLTAWHALCRAIGVEPLPQTCKQCEKVVRRTHVNIVDLIEWGRRRGNTEGRARTFRSEAELRAYTKDTRKIFRNRFDQEDGNVVLRHLLRNIFRGYP
ncbi:hypothetical protein F5Y10DRAFT_243620 [Nemania abortiva]|nr:hypothetical protein F5Y10DRAFT_243620 [Nemania abortiva]